MFKEYRNVGDIEHEKAKQVMTEVATALTGIVDKYFRPGTKMTFVLRHPDEVDGICLSDDRELQKTIKVIENSIAAQFSGQVGRR